MTKTWVLVSVLALGLGCSSQSTHSMKSEGKEEGEEVKMNLADVPPAVRTSLQREAGGASIDKIDREMKNGKTVYETDVMMNGKTWEIQVDENGQLVSKRIEDEADEKNEKNEKNGGKGDKD